jgi:hypothetical protein
LYAICPDRFEDDLVEQQFVAHRESGLTAEQPVKLGESDSEVFKLYTQLNKNTVFCNF